MQNSFLVMDLYWHMLLEFVVLVGVRISQCLFVNLLFECFDFVEVIDTVSSAVYVVFCLEEKQIAGEGKEHGWHFVEAVPDAEDVYHTLAASDEDVAYTLVCGGCEIGPAIVENENTPLEDGYFVQCIFRIVNVSAYSCEDVVVSVIQECFRIAGCSVFVFFGPFDIIWSDNERTLI